MGAWGTSIFSDDLALDIRREYGVLLSVGKDTETIERMLMDYYSSILNCNDPDEDVFWFALAHAEWKKGRLSDRVKEKALRALDSGRDLNRWHAKGNEKDYRERTKVLKAFRELLLSPMPPAKKIRKPTVHHCPWKAGSLLAYQIINQPDEKDHPCFNKYVLLRVVKVEKTPISGRFETDYYNESMLVGLYNWIGNTIPDPRIADDLQYIGIEDAGLPPPVNPIDFSALDKFPTEVKEKLENSLKSAFKKKIAKCVWLDWAPSTYEKSCITFLNCDESFEKEIPEFYGPNIGSCIYTHFYVFDTTLCKRFKPCFENQSDFDWAMLDSSQIEL